MPVSNTSEIEKLQIKVLNEFMRLLNKITGDYTSSIFLTQKNFPYLQNLIDLAMQLMEKGIDQTIKKLTLVLLKQLQISLNGIQPQTLLFVNKNPKINVTVDAHF